MVILKLLTMVVGKEVEDDVVRDIRPPPDAELPTDLLPVHQDVLPVAKTLTKGQWLRALETPIKSLSGPSVPNKTEVQLMRGLLCSYQTEVLTPHLHSRRCIQG